MKTKYMFHIDNNLNYTIFNGIKLYYANKYDILKNKNIKSKNEIKRELLINLDG